MGALGVQVIVAGLHAGIAAGVIVKDCANERFCQRKQQKRKQVNKYNDLVFGIY
jgi:hypothetical protein